MPEETTAPKKSTKRKKATKAASAPKTPREPRVINVPAPQPSPVVIALQEQVLSLVNDRSACLAAVMSSNAALRRAEADANSANERLQLVESEIQYRINLMRQMDANAPQMSYGQAPSMPTPEWTPGWVTKLAASRAGTSAVPAHPAPAEFSGDGPLIQPYSGAIGSVPANRAPAAAAPDIRSESAEDERRAI